MNRQTVYPGAIPRDVDLLQTQQNAMIAFGYLAQLVVGSGTIVDGLACAPTSPASMAVTIGEGSILYLTTLEATAWGSLAADTTDPLVKLGINATGLTSFTLTAPASAGQSQDFLIEAAFLEADTIPVVLPYYNSTLPSQPYSGPANTAVAQNTVRAQTVQLQVKAGTAATTGTQTAPAADSGWTALYVVTLVYAQTTITSSSIAVFAGAPFLGTKLAMVRGNNVAVYKVIGGTQQVNINGGGFSATGATTFPPILGAAKVSGWAAGGGSGGASGATPNGAAPGAGGEYRWGYFSGLTAATTVTVGAPGTAGSATGPTNGGAGGNSSFGSLLTCIGGGGGLGDAGGLQSVTSAGGAGGTGGTFGQAGGPGQLPFVISGSTVFCGVGGAAFGSGTNIYTVSSSATAGVPGADPGQGASAPVNVGAGAIGGTGCIIVEW